MRTTNYYLTVRLLAPLLACVAMLPAASHAHAQGLVQQLNFLGQTSLATGSTFGGTEVGGLSGLTYDRASSRFYALSDDRNPTARFYALNIGVADGALTDGDVQLTGVTTLRPAAGSTFATGSLDPEGIAFVRGSVYVSSEGDAGAGIQPFVNRFDLASGVQASALTIPGKFAVGMAGRGVRSNLAFETLTYTPGGKLVTATENALLQDGPAASTASGSRSRILVYDEASGAPQAEYLYNTAPIPTAAFPTSVDSNGLVDMVALSDTRFIALERSFSANGFSARIYEVSLDGASDISGVDSLTASGTTGIVPVDKRLLLDLGTLGFSLDNVEGLTFGPDLSDGRRSLVLVSDNNFTSLQRTQFLAFGVQVAPGPAALPLALSGFGLLGVLAHRKQTGTGKQKQRSKTRE